MALTGGIATGKSYVLRRLARLGLPTIDADELARDAVWPGRPATLAIARRFGPEVMTPSGEVDRKKLGALVFGDPVSRRDLESIVHPAVYESIQRWFQALADRAIRLGVADIPLLYETGRESDFDRVIVTACAPEEQVRRLMARGGVSPAEARQRLEAQLPIAVKAGRADFVIRTDGTKKETDRQVNDVVKRLSLADSPRAP